MTADQQALLDVIFAPPAPSTGELVVVVHGKPHGQGSKKMVPGGRFIADNDKRLRPWRAAVDEATDRALDGWARPAFGRGVPVTAQLVFTFGRPASHYGTGRNATAMKPSAPKHYMGTPDVDKAVRACFDSLVSAGALWDDRQVVHTVAVKSFPGWHPDALEVPGVVIRLRALP